MQIHEAIAIEAVFAATRNIAFYAIQSLLI